MRAVIGSSRWWMIATKGPIGSRQVSDKLIPNPLAVIHSFVTHSLPFLPYHTLPTSILAPPLTSSPILVHVHPSTHPSSTFNNTSTADTRVHSSSHNTRIINQPPPMPPAPAINGSASGSGSTAEPVRTSFPSSSHAIPCVLFPRLAGAYRSIFAKEATPRDLGRATGVA